MKRDIISRILSEAPAAPVEEPKPTTKPTAPPAPSKPKPRHPSPFRRPVPGPGPKPKARGAETGFGPSMGGGEY